MTGGDAPRVCQSLKSCDKYWLNTDRAAQDRRAVLSLFAAKLALSSALTSRAAPYGLKTCKFHLKSMAGKRLDPLPVGRMRLKPDQTHRNTLKSCKLARTPRAKRHAAWTLNSLGGQLPFATRAQKARKLNDFKDRQAFGASPPVTAFPPPCRVCAFELLNSAHSGR